MKLKNLVAIASAAIIACGCKNNRNLSDGSGTIECTQVQVSSLVAGRIDKLNFDEGDTVKKGDVVALIDRADYELKRNEAMKAVALAQAQLELTVAGSRAEDIAVARARVDEARATVKLAEADLKRIDSLHSAGSATEKQLDDARGAYDRARAGLEAAERTLEKLIAGARKEEIELARAQLESAKAKLAIAEKALADCVIVSPMDGVVTTKIRESGEFVSPGMPILVLSRLDEVWLSIYVPESRLAGVKIGQKAYVKVDGRDELFEGKVTFISPEAEFTPRNVQTPEERAKLVYRVKITLPNKDRIFKPGMPADGYLRSPGKTK